MLRTRTLIALILLILLPTTIATNAAAATHYYGQGHANMTWTHSTFPPYVDGTGSGHLTTNLATFGQAIAFGMPMPTMDLRVLPASAPTPVQGTLIMDVPPASDPWWASYGHPVPPGITTGGVVELTLSGYAEHHPNAVTLYGTYTITATTGQYTGLIGTGQFSGSTTGGPGSFGPYWAFAIMGSYV